MQTLAPHSTYKRETNVDINSFFGGSIAATSDMVVVGCQNCNSSDATPDQSGEIYVYRSNPTRTMWSEAQILTGDGKIKFLGEDVAAHDDIIVATGDPVLTTGQYITDHRYRVAIFQRQRDKDMTRKNFNHFTQLQILTTPNSALYPVSEVAVYDETIVVSSSRYTKMGNPNEIYIFYPLTARYGHQQSTSNPKTKPRSTQWSLHQTLLSLGQTISLNFYLQIQGNNLIYSSYDTTKDQVILYKRSTLTDQWVHTGVSEVDVFEVNAGSSDLYATLTPNQRLYYTNMGTACSLFEPVDLNPSVFHCLQIYVGDQFGDGWRSSRLTVESPSGHKDSYVSQCDSYNPITYRYCPISNDDAGVYKFRVEHEDETSFLWEIMWKIYNERTGKWYYGSYDSEMDFEWSPHFSDFTSRHLRDTVPSVDVCTPCTSFSPKKLGKPRPSLKQLRSLHGKSTTVSPTISPAPTIEVTGLDSSMSLKMTMSNSANDITSWFDSENSGTMYYVSDVDGKKLYASGTACVSGVTEVSCWVELPDGEYVIRVGGALDSSIERQWQFCGGIHYQTKQTELYFTVQDGSCIPSLSRSQSNVCNNILKVTTLSVEIKLEGDFAPSQSLSSEIKLEISSFIDKFLYRRLGEIASSIEISSVLIHESFAEVSVVVGLQQLNSEEIISLVNLLSNFVEHNMDSITSSFFGLHGLDTMSIVAVNYQNEVNDMSGVDETPFQSVTNFISDESKKESFLDNLSSRVIVMKLFHSYRIYIMATVYIIGVLAAVILAVVVPTAKRKNNINTNIGLLKSTSIELPECESLDVRSGHSNKKLSKKKVIALNFQPSVI